MVGVPSQQQWTAVLEGWEHETGFFLPAGIYTLLQVLTALTLRDFWLEDILPFFPDFAVIHTFKQEVCASLEEYNRSVSALKAETDEYIKSAESIREAIAHLKETTMEIPATARCALSGKPLLSGGPFYHFSSGVACLRSALWRRLRPRKRHRSLAASRGGLGRV